MIKFNRKGGLKVHRFKRLIKDKKGASLMIVLACMLFLITIGAVTLSSALSAASVTQTQKDKTKIDLLAESLQITLHQMLNSTVETAGSINLQTAIVGGAYNYNADPANSPNFDSMSLSVDESVLSDSGSGYDIVTHTFDCTIDSQLSVSGSNISGIIYFDVVIDIDPLNQSLTGFATYRIGFSLDSATYDDITNSITSYGDWTLITYEKLQN